MAAGSSKAKAWRHRIETFLPQLRQLTELAGLTNSFCSEDMQSWPQ
jgi:hypothetical protein